MKKKFTTATITPKKCEEFLTHNTYQGQRRLSPPHVDELAEKMKDGRFHSGRIALIHNGQTWLADGQHQCYAAIQANKSFRAEVQEFFVDDSDSPEEIARLFAQYNVDRPRSRGDIAWIYGCQIGMATWPRKIVTLCNTSLGWLHAGKENNGTSTLTKDECAALLATHLKACEFVNATLSNSPVAEVRHLLRSPVVSAMIATFRKSASDAEVFWSAVRDGAMLKKSDPAFKLRELLLKVSVSLGAGARSDRVTVSTREMYCKCICAWNAYRRSQSTDLKYYAEKPMPEVV